MGAIIANRPTNYAFRPAVVDEGYENDDAAAVPSVLPTRTNTATPIVFSPVSDSVIASDHHRSTNVKKRLVEEEYISTKNSKRKTATTLMIQRLTQPHLFFSSPYRSSVTGIMKRRRQSISTQEEG
jgi:hypothetical protein